MAQADIMFQSYFLIFFATVAIASKEFPDQSRQSGSNKRTYDENPKICQCRTALEYSWRYRTSRIHRSSSVTNAHQMNQYQAKTDSQTSEVPAPFFSSVVPSTVSTNTNVKKISANRPPNSHTPH